MPKRRNRNLRSLIGLRLLVIHLLGLTVFYAPIVAQAPNLAASSASQTNRFLGTIESVGPGWLTVMTDTGAKRKITVPIDARLQRITPGATDLSKAATIHFADIIVGDRVLIGAVAGPSTNNATAVFVVSISQLDLTQKQQRDQEEWQRNGVGGLVKNVNAKTGVVVITSSARSSQQNVTLHTETTTIFRRYQGDSVDFDRTKTAPIEAIQIGDQLRARGTRNADGTEFSAAEVVFGSFRNISGIVGAVNHTAMSLTLKDLATKQTVTVHVGPDVQIRRLPDDMAKLLAAEARSSDDLQQMLSRAPAIHLVDIQKRDAVMLVATRGTTEVSAISVLVGVEPLLQAPISTQNMLLSNWNMTPGGAGATQ
jgi:hypothetical protein